MDLGGLGSALLGGGGSAWGEWYANRKADTRQSNANAYSGMMFANRYSMTVADMKRAGLNPMLAYQQGGGSPPSGAISGAGGAANPGEAAVHAYNSTRATTAQTANIEQDTKKKEQETAESASRTKVNDYEALVKQKVPEVMAAQLSEIASNAAKNRAATLQIKKETEKVDNEIEVLKSQVGKNLSETEYNNKMSDLTDKKKVLTVAETFLTNAQTAKTTAQRNILVPEEKAAKHESQEWSHVIGNIMRSLNPFGAVK